MPRPAPCGDSKETGFVVWLTGLPGSGKSTISRALDRELKRSGYHTQVLDGDELRRHPGFDTGFDRSERVKHLQRVVHICNLLIVRNVVVIASFVSPYRSVRSFAKKQIGRFAEVYVKCPIEVCMERDPKGLYHRAALGQVEKMTGIDGVYEEPLNPDVIVETSRLTVAASVNLILKGLERLRFVRVQTRHRRRDG